LQIFSLSLFLSVLKKIFFAFFEKLLYSIKSFLRRKWLKIYFNILLLLPKSSSIFMLRLTWQKYFNRQKMFFKNQQTPCQERVF
jgi:hypothetical protein